MSTAIVGGGIMGVTLGYFLAKAGVPVTIYEGSPTLGGLAGPITLPDGVDVDRFYHAILSSDEHLMTLCAELGISDRLRFKPTGTLVYSGGRLVSMNGIVDFLKFPPLRFVDRIRLGLTVVAANRVKDWHDLEHVPMRDWLVKHGGAEVYRRFWGPMLQAKFDGAVGDTPATWMWSRLVRTRATRKGVNQKEESGHLIGGYRTLLEAMAGRIRELGGADPVVDADRPRGHRERPGPRRRGGGRRHPARHGRRHHAGAGGGAAGAGRAGRVSRSGSKASATWASSARCSSSTARSPACGRSTSPTARPWSPG